MLQRIGIDRQPDPALNSSTNWDRQIQTYETELGGQSIDGTCPAADHLSRWQDMNLRRSFFYLEDSIDEGMQWAVFEPN